MAETHALPAGAAEPLLTLVLARCAAEGGATRSEVARDLAGYLPQTGGAAAAKVRVTAVIDQAVRQALAEEQRQRLALSERGRALLQDTLGGAVARTWPEIRDGRLLIRALGLVGEPAARQKLATRTDGLRALVVVRSYGLKLRGNLSPARIRAALAVVALARAFGNKIRGELGAGDGLSTKASRLLASKLSSRRREFGSDSRLVAALAAESLGLRSDSIEDLRAALLRRYAAGTAEAPASPVANETKRPAAGEGPAARPPADRPPAPSSPPAPAAVTAPRPAEPPSCPAAASRPDLAGFVREVQAVARTRAEGWPGNRKAYVCHVWSGINHQRPEWGLSEIEFKSMLAEAHRTGHIVLANADLKDKRTQREVQASAIAYKNTVWHFVRVED
jgi:hypothetical protein